MAAVTQAEGKAAQGLAPAYIYPVAWQHPVQKAYHTLEIPFAFDNADLNRKVTTPGPDSYKLLCELYC